jgi:hypothetical protein
MTDWTWKPPPNHRCPVCKFDRPRQGHREDCPEGSREAGHAAYAGGLCRMCRERRHSAGRTLCEPCFRAERGLS